jgi:hypothetical protein
LTRTKPDPLRAIAVHKKTAGRESRENLNWHRTDSRLSAQIRGSQFVVVAVVIRAARFATNGLSQ